MLRVGTSLPNNCTVVTSEKNSLLLWSKLVAVPDVLSINMTWPRMLGTVPDDAQE